MEYGAGLSRGEVRGVGRMWGAAAAPLQPQYGASGSPCKQAVLKTSCSRYSKPVLNVSCCKGLTRAVGLAPSRRSSIPVVTCVLGIFVENRIPSRSEATSLIVLCTGVMIAVWQVRPEAAGWKPGGWKPEGQAAQGGTGSQGCGKPGGKARGRRAPAAATQKASLEGGGAAGGASRCRCQAGLGGGSQQHSSRGAKALTVEAACTSVTQPAQASGCQDECAFVLQGAVTGKPYAIVLCLAGTVSNAAMMTFSGKVRRGRRTILDLPGLRESCA